MAVAQVLRYDNERHWLRAARKQVGHLFPRLLAQSENNARLKNAAPLIEAALRWLLMGEREQARNLLEHQPANCPAPGTAIITNKSLSGEDTEAFFAGPDLGLTLIRPARKDENQPRYFPVRKSEIPTRSRGGYLTHHLHGRGPGDVQAQVLRNSGWSAAPPSRRGWGCHWRRCWA